MSTDARLASAMVDWQDGPQRLRRLRAGLDTRAVGALDRAERALRTEVLRRLGPSYRVADVLSVYADSEAWTASLIADSLRPRSIPAAAAPLADSVFGRAAQQARDARDVL